MTVLPRILTSGEKTKLRAQNPASRVYLTIYTPATIYSAQLAAVPSSTDQVTSITYNGGSGTYTNIKADMTMYVGSSAGAYDRGIVRIRNTTGLGATSGTFNIGEESEINWQSGDYLTVVDEFAIWPRHIKLQGTTPYMDNDVAYSDQHANCDPVPVLGPDVVLWLTNGTVNITPDASQSWVIGSTISGHSWTAAGANATINMTTATPTISYNAAGNYRISDVVTAANGKTFTGYRRVIVLDGSETYPAFRIDSVSGDFADGGWTADVTLFDNATRAAIRDRSLVILHAQDSYGGVAGSAGFVAGYENILFEGHIIGESIKWATDDKYGEVTFTVAGPQAWLDMITAFPEGMKDVTSAPVKWTKFQSLSIKSATWHMLHWRSTLTRCNDVYPITDTTRAARIEAAGAQTLWEQLRLMLDSTVVANACADRYGRLFLQVEQQAVPEASRSTIPECMELEKQDWTGQIQIERSPLRQTSYVDLSGVSFDGSRPTPYFSLSPGRVFSNYGKPIVYDQLALTSQAQSNTLAGLISGWKNNELPRINIDLASGNRFVDIAPYQYWLLDIASADTPRGIVKTNLRMIPRRVQYNFNQGYMTTSVEFEAETFTDIAVTGDAPLYPPNQPIIPPVLPPVPTPVPVARGDATEVWFAHDDGSSTPPRGVVYSTDFFSALGSPTWNSVATLPTGMTEIDDFAIANDGAKCWIMGRASAAYAIWECANPKDGSPTWTTLVDSTDVVKTHPTYGAQYFAFTSNLGFTGKGWGVLSGSIPYYGAYSGSGSIGWYGGQGRNPDGSPRDPYGLWFDQLHYVTNKNRGLGIYSGGAWWSPLPDSHNSTNTIDQMNHNTAWVNSDNRMYVILNLTNIIRFTLGASYQVLATFPALIGTATMHGAWTGRNVQYVGRVTGDVYRLIYSEDGVAFYEDTGPDWIYGRIHNTKLEGNRFMVWIGESASITNSNEFIRYSGDVKDHTTYPWTAATGDLWTNVITAGNLKIIRSGLVYGNPT